MKTRHAKGVPCPHNKGFSIKDPELKKKFDSTDPNIIGNKERKKKATKREQWRDPNIPYKEKPSYVIIRPKCPKCTSAMKVRVNKAKGTRFWGCNRYPTCKGTKSMI